LWDLNIAKSLRKGHTIAIFALSQLGIIIATKSEDGIVEVRTAKSGKLVWTLHDEPSDYLQPWQFRQMTGFSRYIDGRTPIIRVCDLRSGRLYAASRALSDTGQNLPSFRSDSTQLVVRDSHWTRTLDLGSHPRRVWKSKASAYKWHFLHRMTSSRGRNPIVLGYLDAFSGEQVVTMAKKGTNPALHGP